jgi:hypothetical protein
MARSCSWGVMPSGGVSRIVRWVWAWRPATRTMKNSSRFEAKIPRNFSRSKIGTSGDAPSASTRALNSSQDSSRFR